MPPRRVKHWERRRCARACGHCKRRKERCDGQLPCGRCSIRGVANQCSFMPSPRTLNSSLSCGDSELNTQSELGIDHQSVQLEGTDTSSSHHALRSAPTQPPSRPTSTGHASAITINDSANKSFLQIARHLVRDSLGPGIIADDTEDMLAATQAPGQPSWAPGVATQPPPKPEPSDALYLLRWCIQAIHIVAVLFDEQELCSSLSQWLRAETDEHKQQAMTTIFFLIFAIGSQTCPENRDEIAERYFNYGRFCAVSQNMETPDVCTVQAHALVTIYLLGASRGDAAFMYLGTAIRAGYALGIDRRDVNALYGSSQYATRERLWKVLRVLDLFMSASLGHPPSTYETRDTAAEADYSASNELCFIFEIILTDVYSRRAISKNALERITEHHKQWTKRFPTGLAADNIKSTEFIDTGAGKKAPNIGLYHLKEAYYWAIMLVARPFLVKSVSKRVSETTSNSSPDEDAKIETSLDRIVSHACVDSAIRTVDLLGALRSSDEIPKRLPFVVNSLFVASLVLGVAQLGDMDSVFPISKSLTKARRLLLMFSHWDAGSKRNLAVVDNLQAACDVHLERRFKRKMERQSLLIEGMFGMVHNNINTQMQPLFDEVAFSGGAQNSPVHPKGHSAPEPDAEESCNGDHCDSASPACLGPRECLNFGVEDMMPDFATMADLALPLSPTTLAFESLDNEPPSTSAPYACPLQIADMLVDQSVMDILRQQGNWS